MDRIFELIVWGSAFTIIVLFGGKKTADKINN